jgi:sugar/nucleoside kinase (ribokinase family)
LNSADRRGAPPNILCAGIIVLDEVFLVEDFPQPDGKVNARGYFSVNGGCAANAAVAIARLGGAASLCGPLGGPAGEDANGDRVLAALARERVDTKACVRVAGCASPLSAIFIDARGDRMITTYRDDRIASAQPPDPARLVASANAVLADNRFPDFVRPICAAARKRGLTVVLDADKPTQVADPLLRMATHVVFSSESLRATAGTDDLATALFRVGDATEAFLAVTDGSKDVLWRDGNALRQSPAYPVKAVDTLGAGDVFHGGFTLALAEGRNLDFAMRFASAAAAIKCSRLGGSAGAPDRDEVAAFMAAHENEAAAKS